MTHSWKRARHACVYLGPATAVAVIVGSTVGPGIARADGAVFDSYAQAIGVQATLSNRTLPLGLVIEGVGPEASSRVTSFGQSDAEASFPYTGTVVPGLFGLGPPLLLGVPGIEYPAQAATQAGSPPQDVDFPGISLHAESGVTSNYAEAVLGGAALGGGSSTSRIDRDEVGNVLATATAQFNSLKLGTSLTLSNVRSVVTVAADQATGKLTRTSSFSIGRLSVPGLSFTVPKTSPAQASPPNPIPGLPQAPPVPLAPIPLPFAGQTLPAPDIGLVDGNFTITLPGFGSQKFAAPADAVLAGFKSAGFDFAYQPAVETPTGMQGGVFTARYTFDKLPDNQYFSGPVPVTYNIGSAAALVDLSPIAAGTAAAVNTGSGVAPDGSAAPSTGVDLGTAPGVNPGGAVPAVGLPTVQLVPGTGVGTAGSDSVERASAPLPLTSNQSTFYVLFVVVVVAQLLAMTALRKLGVRGLWKF